MDEEVRNAEVTPAEVEPAEAPAERTELFDTKGFDLLKVIADARANGNAEFADLVEKQIANVQACYDVIAQAYTSQGGQYEWKVDAEYLKTILK